MERNVAPAAQEDQSPVFDPSQRPLDGSLVCRFNAHLVRFLTRHPIKVLLVLSGVTAVAVALAKDVRHDFSPRAMVAGNHQLQKDTRTISNVFGDDDSAMLVLLEATGPGDVLDKQALTWQAKAARRLAQLPDVEEVRCLPELKREQLQLGFPPQRLRVPLVKTIPADSHAEAGVRRYFEEFPNAANGLLGEDRKVVALPVKFGQVSAGLEDWERRVAAVRSTISNLPPPEGYRVRVSGRPVVRVDIVHNLQADQRFLIPVAGLVYLLVLALLFRRISGSLILLGVVGMGICWGLAIMVLCGQTLNLISNVLPMLLLILGVSNGVHIMCRYAEETARSTSRREAAVTTLRHMGGACLLAFLTTAIGFGSLLAARSEAMNAFATQALLGLGCLYVSIVVALGTLLAFLRPPQKEALKRVSSDEWDRVFQETKDARRGIPAALAGLPRRLLGAVADVVVRRPLVVLMFSALLAVGSVWLARGIQVNSYTVETYDDDHPTVRTMRLVENQLGGGLTFNVMLRARENGRFMEPETMRRVAALEKFVKEQPEVLSARSYVDLHRAIDDRVNGGVEENWPPLGEEGRSRLARSSFFMKRVADDVDYDSYITADADQVQLRFHVRDVGTSQMLQFTERVRSQIGQTFPAQSDVTAVIGGDAYVNARAIDTMIRDLFYTVAIAAVVIFAVMALLFRSLRLGLISAIPNLTPLLLTLGYMGLRGYDMNAANVIVFTISLGVAVDDTIHFLCRYREEQRYSPDDPLQTVRATMRAASWPILLTSLLIICGLAVLFLSNFVPTRRFAELTIVTMIGALFGDLLLLPAALLLFGKKSPSHHPVAKVRKGTPRPSEAATALPDSAESVDEPVLQEVGSGRQE